MIAPSKLKLAAVMYEEQKMQAESQRNHKLHSYITADQVYSMQLDSDMLNSQNHSSIGKSRRHSSIIHYNDSPNLMMHVGTNVKTELN